jgi:hypothetical protein
MGPEELAWLREHEFAPSRIPKLDALSILVPTSTEQDPLVVEMHKRVGFSRWFPVEGGHRVLFPFEGGEYDHSRFTIESQAWDHETCKSCRAHIPALTLCWATQAGPYIILCERCHKDIFGAGVHT